MKLIGLTGSIGMGKSTTAGLFSDMGLPVYDADAAVHRLYAPGGAAVAPVGALFPEVVVEGGIDRRRLSARVLGDDAAMRALEAVVHPLVGGDRQAFFDQAVKAGADLVILDVPLLFETGGARGLDAGPTGHGCGQVRGHPCPPDAGRRQAGPRRLRGGHLPGSGGGPGPGGEHCRDPAPARMDIPPVPGRLISGQDLQSVRHQSHDPRNLPRHRNHRP